MQTARIMYACVTYGQLGKRMQVGLIVLKVAPAACRAHGVVFLRLEGGLLRGRWASMSACGQSRAGSSMGEARHGT